MLNPDKSEAIWCTTSRRQLQLPTATIPIVGVPITPARFVRDLGIYIDADMSMRAHVNQTVSRCFAALCRLRQIRRAVPTATLQILVVALVHSLLDYCVMQYWSASQPTWCTVIAVGAQCGGTTHLPPATARPHHRCVGDTTLAARPRTRAVQDRRANVPTY